MEQLAYSCWRFEMWLDNYGSYEDIEWAQSWRLLRPFRKPWRIAAPIVKFIIRQRNKPAKCLTQK